MKLSRKTLVTALTFLLIGIIISSVVWVYAQPSTPFTISEGIYPSAFTYTHSREGSTYYVKNAYGQIPSWGSGTNATTVINNAITASPIGASHFFKLATYSIDGVINFKDETSFEGEGRSKFQDYSSSTIFDLTTTSATFNLQNAEGARLSHLTIQGNNIAKGITIGNDTGKSASYIFNDIVVRNCTYGIYNDVTTTGFYDSYIVASAFQYNDVGVQLKELMNVFEQTVFTRNKVAVEFDSSTTGHWALFDGNVFSGNDYDFDVTNINGLAFTVKHTWFENEGWRSLGVGNGNVFTNSSGLNVGTKGIIFEHSYFSPDSPIDLSWVTYGLSFLETVVFRECNFQGWDSLAQFTLHGGYYPFFDNSWRYNSTGGFEWVRSENNGVATISASTSVVVSHGVFTTPTSVIVTLGTTGAGDYYVDTLTSTQFTVHVTNSGTYTVYFEAQYQP